MAHIPLAVLIPANPLEYYEDSEEIDRSDVDAHKKHADEHEFVYWNVPASGRNHAWMNDDVRAVYFVQPSKKPPYRCDEVIYRGDIVSVEHFKTKNDMRLNFPPDEVQFLYGTRRKIWELESNGGYNWNSWPGVSKWGFILIKIRNIRKLETLRKIEDFTKAFWPNQRVQRCQKYVITFDEFFE